MAVGFSHIFLPHAMGRLEHDLDVQAFAGTTNKLSNWFGREKPNYFGEVIR